jgi:glycosyltransferase involved in cell wall biosynthesis
MAGPGDRDSRELAEAPVAMKPAIALLPWGDAIEDFLETAGSSLESFRDEMTGGWMFGYVDALRTAGVETALICFSRDVTTPRRWRHRPTGAPLLVLPLPRAYRVLRRTLADPYAWSAEEAARRPGRTGKLLVQPPRQLAPYIATPVRLLAREVRRTGASAILCQEYEYQRFDVAVVAGRLVGVPVFATFQGGAGTRTGLERAVRPLSLRACAGLVIASRAEAERVRRRYGIGDDRVLHLLNPLDVTPWIRSGRRPGRAELRFGDDEVVVAWHGRVDLQRKGLDVLADAWRRLQGPGRRLLLIGTGRDAGMLRERIAGLSGVTWVDDYVLDKRRIATLLASADVYAFPSRHEGLPVAPLEAMACGLPLVAADAPGVSEILPEGERSGGIVVPSGDPAALAEALDALLRDPSRRAEIGACARRRVEDAFSPQAVGHRLRRFLLREPPAT